MQVRGTLVSMFVSNSSFSDSQMLKTEDKKHMKEQDFVQLNTRQERNRIFNRVRQVQWWGFMVSLSRLHLVLFRSWGCLRSTLWTFSLYEH